jgi:hypothetical protein
MAEAATREGQIERIEETSTIVRIPHVKGSAPNWTPGSMVVVSPVGQTGPYGVAMQPQIIVLTETKKDEKPAAKVHSEVLKRL